MARALKPRRIRREMREIRENDIRLSHDHSHGRNRFAVIPTAVRMDSFEGYTGRGVTIALLDSGFYPHPDLTRPENRILAHYDVATGKVGSLKAARPGPWQWHGTQTSVVAAGNGFLSDGIYRGIASEAGLVLVKVSDRGRISDEAIVKGLNWVVENRERYNIRIVSMSLGGDGEISFNESIVDQAAERAVTAGLVLIAAAGNAGCTGDHRPIPPANSPSVLAVGGFNDENVLGNQDLNPYCSSFGPTIDGLIKPEVVSPAIWVASPILPQTDAYAEAEMLSEIAAAPDYQLPVLTEKYGARLGLTEVDPDELRSSVESRLRESKIVATHYQHVDGTSFAAPIAASVAAQMIEANPRLTPSVVRNILISTADRAPGLSLMQQGYGVINARRAVEAAMSETHVDSDCDFNPPRIEGDRLIFWYHNDTAESVTLAGEFNGWNPDSIHFERHLSGMWRAGIEVPEAGKYEYKFVIDGRVWVDDPGNAVKTDDGHGGLNSLLFIGDETKAR